MKRSSKNQKRQAKNKHQESTASSTISTFAGNH